MGLGAALLVAGPLSERVGRTPLMYGSLFTSSLAGLACGIVTDWNVLLGLRALEGVLLSGLPAVAMAYLGEELVPSATVRAAGLYIGGTAIGGMAGRLVTGFVAANLGWRAALVAIGALGLLCAVAVVVLLPRSRRFVPAPAGFGHLARSTGKILGDPVLLGLFLIAAAGMGAFVGLFNAMAFRLEAPPYSFDVGTAGLIFLTYALGSVGSALAGRAAGRWGPAAVTPYAALVMLGGLLVAAAEPVWLIVVGTGLFALGFFATHGVASGWVVAHARARGEATGQASSAYLFAYYAGSSAVGALAGLAWASAGWTGVTLLSGGLILLVIGAALVLRSRRRNPSAA